MKVAKKLLSLCALSALLAGCSWITIKAPQGQVALKGWPPPRGIIFGYNVYLSDLPDAGFHKINPKPITTGRYLVRGLDIGRKYYFEITALERGEPPVESRPSASWQMLSQAP